MIERKNNSVCPHTVGFCEVFFFKNQRMDQKSKPRISKKALLLGVVLLIELTGHGIVGSLFRLIYN